MDLIPILLAICAVFAIHILKIVTRAGASKSIPGPKFSFPILGHLPFLLGAEPWLTITQWKRTYGPIFAIKMGVYDVIILNDSKVLKEAYGRPEFNGRPRFELFKAANEGKGFAFTDGPLCTEQKAFAVKHLRGFTFRSSVFQDTIREELNLVLEDIEKKCGRPLAINGKFSIPVLNAIWNMFMGQRFKHDDPQLHKIHYAVRNYITDDGVLAAISPFVPAVSKFMPELSGYNKKVESLRSIYAMVKKSFDEPLPATRTFGDPKNFKEAFIDEMERVGDNTASSFHPAQNSFQYSVGDVLMGAIDAVSTTLEWLFLCMVKHPAVQEKVQAEIHEKFGTTGVPALSDKDNTPYTEAVIQELLRFSSFAPLGGPMHRVMEDTNLRGFNIKKDTLVIFNMYGVNYDENVWDDPANFRPDRFIDGNGTVNRNLMKTMLPFTTGKRSCPGETLSRDLIYLWCTNIFQRFHVSSDPDIELEFTRGMLRAPIGLTVTFTKRFVE